MIRKFAPLMLVLLALLGTVSARAETNIAGLLVDETPQRLPLIVFYDQDGKQYQLRDFRGKLLVVNLWASWCVPCITEMPSLSRLQRQMGAQGLQVITISQDRDERILPGFFQRLRIDNLPLYIDTLNRIPKTWNVPGLPASYIVNAQGQAVARIFGSTQWDSPEMIQFLRQYLPPGS